MVVKIILLAILGSINFLKDVDDVYKTLEEKLMENFPDTIGKQGIINEGGIDIYIGWQEIPKNWASIRGYFGVYITCTLKLRLFAISRPNAKSNVRFWCFLCKKRSCHHTTEHFLETPEDKVFVMNFPFYYEDRDQDGSVFHPSKPAILSTKKYPCRLYRIMF